MKESYLRKPHQLNQYNSQNISKIISVGLSWRQQDKKDLTKAILILPSYFYYWKLKYNKDSRAAWPQRFIFPCMTFRFFPSLRVFNQSCNYKYDNNIQFLELLFIFSLTLKLSLMRYMKYSQHALFQHVV